MRAALSLARIAPGAFLLLTVLGAGCGLMRPPGPVLPPPAPDPGPAACEIGAETDVPGVRVGMTLVEVAAVLGDRFEGVPSPPGRPDAYRWLPSTYVYLSRGCVVRAETSRVVDVTR